MRNQRGMRILFWGGATLVLLALGACGGGGSSSAGSTAATTLPSEQASADGFFDQVFALVSAPTESGDPVSIDGYAVNQPENATPKSF